MKNFKMIFLIIFSIVAFVLIAIFGYKIACKFAYGFETGDKYVIMNNYDLYRISIYPRFNYDFLMQEYTYKSTNPSVAVVLENGVIKPLKPGKTTIEVYSKKEYNSKVIEVTVDDLEVNTFECESATIEVNETYELRPIVNGSADLRSDYTYKVENNNITVDKNGKVKGITPGLSSVTVTNNKGKSTICLLTVVEHATALSEIEITSKDRVVIGEAFNITANVVGDSSFNEYITLASSDISILTIDKTGKAVAKGVGKVTINAILDGYIATKEINVIAKP